MLELLEWQLGNRKPCTTNRLPQVAPGAATADSQPPIRPGSCQHTDIGFSLWNDCLHDLLLPECECLHGAIQ